MKKIVLTLVKNEALLLRDFLAGLTWADAIILADQNSTDATREIAAEFPNVHVINNPTTGHSNKGRWLLLDHMRQMFPADPADEARLVFCLDADEFLTTEALTWTTEQARTHITSNNSDNAHDTNTQKAVRFHYPWIQLYSDEHAYRVDDVWKKNVKSFAWIDTPSLDYVRTEVINDHTERIPAVTSSQETIELYCPAPVLHLQFLFTKKTELKQALYMCRERLAGGNADLINLKYYPSIKMVPKRKIKKVPSSWLNNFHFDTSTFDDANTDVIFKDLTDIFADKGLKMFEPLLIWNNPRLGNLFRSTTGRIPRTSTKTLLLIAFAPLISPLFSLIPRRVKNMIKSGLK